MSDVREKVLTKAFQIVSGERDVQYGSPEDNFKIIANLWSIYLSGKDGDIRISPKDVAMMMSLLKIARIRTGVFSEDSYIDLAGYAACGCECASTAEVTSIPVGGGNE